MPRGTKPPRQPASEMQNIRDALLRMTWRELEGFAELLEAERSTSDVDRDTPITGEMLNSWASEIEFEGE